MRYMKQRDNYSCGPVAIMNVLKWAGLKFSYGEKIDYISKLCKCKAPGGSYHNHFDKALRNVTDGLLKIQKIKRPKLAQIEEHLKTGGVVIINYAWKKIDKKGRHYALIADINKSELSMLLINDFEKGPARCWVSRQMFRTYNLRFQRTDPYYKAWFVYK